MTNAYNPQAKYVEASAIPTSFTPAVWLRGAGEWLDRDAEPVKAFGRTVDFNLDRDLELANFQAGVDFGKQDLISERDILVFGLLGGAILGDLEYDALARHFDFDGGEVGAYATYLRGGLFVDTLANAQFLDIEPEGAPIFRGSLDSTNFGLRTDAGYRFGGFNRGFFFEPLATIGVVWSDIDGFTREGSTVSFDDDANVRGRHGLRVGTSYEAWQGILMEPFLIGSVWSNLSGDNQARITSSGSIDIEDDPEDTGARSLPGSTSSIQTRAPLCSPSSTSPSATTSTASAAKPAFATIGETGL